MLDSKSCPHTPTSKFRAMGVYLIMVLNFQYVKVAALTIEVMYFSFTSHSYSGARNTIILSRTLQLASNRKRHKMTIFIIQLNTSKIQLYISY